MNTKLSKTLFVLAYFGIVATLTVVGKLADLDSGTINLICIALGLHAGVDWYNRYGN